MSGKSNTSGASGPHVRASNDAFGKTSPHWNLPFPVGRLTAAEILAYCPHWLKSIDVINRFVINGGKAKVIAGMLNQFRIMPRMPTISVNSVCVMMQCAMRNAGYANWTMRVHEDMVNNGSDDGTDDTNIDVSNFRTPRITHPKKGSKSGENVDAAPIEFRDLALNVKEHPSGDDALDLTRCVQYALNHPTESWLFPDDFERLVNKLGGPQPLSHLHFDAEAFARRSDTHSIKSRPTTSLATAAAATTKQVRLPDPNSMVNTRRLQTRLATPKKRGHDEVDSLNAGAANMPGKRRSGRISELTPKNMHETDSDVETLYYKSGADHGHAQKKRKTSPDSSIDDEFVANSTTDTESVGGAYEDVSDDLYTPQSQRPIRASAQRGRRLTQQVIAKETPKYAMPATDSNQPAADAAPKQVMVPDYLIDPVLLGIARHWTPNGPPTFATPPVLGGSRLVVDLHNIWLYAEEGCTSVEQMWQSALSSTRFNGPRKHAPFRELYRLTDPVRWDVSDWAENIRWAKEQYRAFGVTTWTEYDDHLEQITQIRRKTLWVSEEAVTGGGLY